MSDRTPHDSKG